MVEVEQRSLRSLQEDSLAVAERSPQERAGVVDVRRDAIPHRQVLISDPVAVQGQPVVDLRQDGVLLLQHDLELLAEDLGVREVLDPKPDPRRLVGVGRPDPALRRAEPVAAQVALGDLVQLQVVRHDQVGVAAHDQPGRVDPSALDLVDLL